MRTKFHHLCNDIIIELFSYFNVHEIFYSFCLVIPRLPALLADGHVPLYIRSNNAYFIRWILPHIKLNEVISIDLPLRPYNPSLFSFVGLRSLVIRDVDNPLLLFQNNNNGWPPYNLEHLSLHIRNQDTANQSIDIGARVLELAFQLRQLKYFELHESKSSFKMVGLFDELNFPSTFHSTNMQSLTVNVYCSYCTVQSILKYAPRLRRIKFRSSFSYSDNLSQYFHFPFVRQLDLQLHGVQLNNFLKIFESAPLLRRCSLICSFYLFTTEPIDLLTSDTWMQIIRTYTPQLKILDVDISFSLDGIDENIIEMINEDLKNLNFKLQNHAYCGKSCWKITGILNRVCKIK